MNSTVFENWMDYISEGKVKNFDEFLDAVALNFTKFGFGTEISEYGYVSTFFEIEMVNGEELWLPAFSIHEDTDGQKARATVEANYEIYIQLLWKFYGIEAFKIFDENVSFDDYLNRIIELIEIAFGKTQDTDDCETCSMCLHTPEDWEVA